MNETTFQFGVYKGNGGGGGVPVMQWNEVQIIYVGKHGNDANNGRSINQAKLTIQNALDQCVIDGVSVNNKYVVCVLDRGTYTERLIIYNYVKLFAPNATLNVTGDIGITMQEFSALECENVFAQTNSMGIGFVNVTHTYYDVTIKVEKMTALTTRNCIFFTDSFAGQIALHVNTMTVVDGACLRNSGTSPDFRFTGFINEMVATGSDGGGFLSADKAATYLTINHIKIVNSSKGIGILLASSAYVRILANYIECVSGIAITITDGNSYIFANKIDGTVSIANNIVAVVDVSKRNNYSAGVPPTANDDAGDGYSVGSAWFDTAAQRIYDCTQSTIGVAIWLQRMSGTPFTPQRDEFTAAPAQDTFVLTFTPFNPAKLNIYVLGMLWQSTRYAVSYDGGLLAWKVVLDTPQAGGEDIIVTE